MRERENRGEEKEAEMGRSEENWIRKRGKIDGMEERTIGRV